MEPFSIILIVLSLLSGSAISARALGRYRKKKKQLFRASLVEHAVNIRGEDLTIFALFWDLGVSDYALEIMAAQRVLPRDISELPAALEQFEHLVLNYESYGAFSRDMLDAIQEFYDLHKQAGPRRHVPALKSTDRKSIKIAAIGSTQTSPSKNELIPYHNPILDLDRDIDGRVAARSDDIPLLAFGSDGDVIDIDEVGVVSALDFLEGLFYGSFKSKIDKWFKLRQLRRLKTELDQELIDFHQYFVNQTRCVPHFVDHIYDMATRWEKEKQRIEALRIKRPWMNKPWSKVADLLVDHALEKATKLQTLARDNIDFTLGRIAAQARMGNPSLAGYLVYLNQHAFFAGRSPGYGEGVRKIERAAYRVQQEIVSLKRQGVI